MRPQTPKAPGELATSGAFGVRRRYCHVDVCGSLSSELVDALSHRGLLVRGLVLVDHALAHGLVELAGGFALQLHGLGLVTGVGGLAELADRGLHRRLHRLVALAALLVGVDALDLRLDVGHYALLRLDRRLRRRRACTAPNRGDPGFLPCGMPHGND